MNKPPINGLMLDMARVTEQFDHYLAMAKDAADFGYNTIFAHVTDNEGCAIVFDARPELAGPHALTKPQLQQWIDAANGAGVSIIPEIECFGHTRFIHDLPKYKHLAMPASGHFNAINPIHPDTHAILEDLLRETAERFDSPYIHAGFDEVNLGDRTVLGDAVAGKDDWEIFADMVNHVHAIITRLGKRMMIWGDHLISEPRIAERIPKDIIICDWQYHPDLTDKTTHALIDAGFQVLCCPASSRSGDMLMPRSNTLGNLQRFARIAHDAGDSVLGLVNTCWCPARMLCDTERFAFAVGAAWFDNPEADPLDVVSRFVEQRFGITDQPRVLAQAIIDLSMLIPHNGLFRRIMQTETSAKAPPSPITASEAHQMASIANTAIDLRAILKSQRDRATFHQDELDNYLLVCDLIQWFDQLAMLRLKPQDAKSSSAIAMAGTVLLDRCRHDWNRRRHADDPVQQHDTYGEHDGLISNFTKALAQLTQAQPTDPVSMTGQLGALN